MTQKQIRKCAAHYAMSPARRCSKKCTHPFHFFLFQLCHVSVAKKIPIWSRTLGVSEGLHRHLVVFVAPRCFMSEQNIGSKFYTQGRIIRTSLKRKDMSLVLHAVCVRGCHRLFATEAQAGAAEVACWCRSACSTEQDNASCYGVNRKELQWNGRVCPD